MTGWGGCQPHGPRLKERAYFPKHRNRIYFLAPATLRFHRSACTLILSAHTHPPHIGRPCVCYDGLGSEPHLCLGPLAMRGSCVGSACFHSEPQRCFGPVCGLSLFPFRTRHAHGASPWARTHIINAQLHVFNTCCAARPPLCNQAAFEYARRSGVAYKRSISGRNARSLAKSGNPFSEVKRFF